MRIIKTGIVISALVFGMMLGCAAAGSEGTPAAVSADELQLRPNLQFARVVFDPKDAVYPYTGKAVQPAFQVLMPDLVPSSEYTYTVVSKDDPEAGTSAGILPGSVTIEITGNGDESFGYFGSQRVSYRIAKAAGLKAKECKVICNTAEGSFDLDKIILDQSDCGKRTYTLGKLTDENGLLSDISVKDSTLHFSLKAMEGSAAQVVTVTTEKYEDVDVTITLEAAALPGDCNRDGKSDHADVACLQNWLTGAAETKLVNWKAADLNADGKLDALDLTMMKRKLLSAKSAAKQGEEMKTPKNMPEIIDSDGAVSNSDKTKLWEELFFRYPNQDLSDFKLVYASDHPLARQIGGPAFYVYYKDLLVHGYGDLGRSQNVYAAIEAGGSPVFELLVSPEEIAAVDLDAACVSEEKLKQHNPVGKAEKIIYIDSRSGKPTAKLAFRMVLDYLHTEDILDAATGEVVETISFVDP